MAAYLNGGVGAELGVHKGYFTSVLLRVARPSVLYIVDPWYLLGSQWEWSGGNRSTTRALAHIIRRFESELVSGQIRLVIDDDLTFLRDLSHDSLDWAYIDSSHEYSHTLAELHLLESRVTAEGLIAGDDWNSDANHRHSGVCKAVTAFCNATNFRVIYADDRSKQWVIGRE